MSLSAALHTAFTGLITAQQSLGVTAHNVANTNTPGYTRKVLEQQSLMLGGRGSGVEAGDLARLTDEFVLGEVRRQVTVAARSEVVTRYQDRIQDFLGAPGENRDLAVQIGQLATALDGLANNPEASAQALEAVNLAEGLGLSVETLSAQVQRMRAEADREIAVAVGEINDDLHAIAALNREITRLARLGQDHIELVDRRDVVLKSLAAKIDITTFSRGDGSLVVQTGSGQALVEGEARILVYDRAVHVGQATVFESLSIFAKSQIDPASGRPFAGEAGIVLVSGGLRAELTPELAADPDAAAIHSRIGGGRLAGLLEVRDRLLPQLDDQIQELADGIRYALNAAHNRGVPSPPPATLTGTRTDLAAFAGAARDGVATIAVVDPATGSTLAAFPIDLGAAADVPALVAQINAGLGAFGTAAIGPAGNLVVTAAGNWGIALDEGDSRVTVVDAAGRVRDYGFSHFFGLNDLMVTRRDLPSTLTVRADLRAMPSRISTARLDVDPGPPLLATLGGRGDNRGALALALALRSEHAIIARGTLPARAASMLDYAGDIIAHGAILAERARETAGREGALAEALEFRAAAVSGVNIDEEMTRLMLFQQAYSASARILTVTNQLFDELLRLAG
jgi:flagellar hook-associated protein 1